MFTVVIIIFNTNEKKQDNRVVDMYLIIIFNYSTNVKYKIVVW